MKSGGKQAHVLKTEAKYFYETSVHMNGLHGCISRKMEPLQHL
jgi:hypothetical protein